MRSPFNEARESITRYSEVALDSVMRTIVLDAKVRRFCVTPQSLPTAWVNVPPDPLQFFLPFDLHLRTITEARISAPACADGMPRTCC